LVWTCSKRRQHSSPRCASIVRRTRLFIVSVFRAHYTGSVETDPLDDRMGSREQARGEVNRATIDTIVQ
jgi:hypothetical protein